MIKALIGLGNSGKEYRTTYHNVGTFVASIIRDGMMPKHELLVYPLIGYMNESGNSVGAWVKMNNLILDEILVIHDDGDLPIGSYKLVRGGGSAGHKGIESIIANLGDNFWRLRIGIRDPKELVRVKTGDFVLKQWSSKEEERFIGVAGEAQLAITQLL